MGREFSFRKVLLLTLVGVAICSMILVGVMSLAIHRQSVDDLSSSLSQQTLQRVADRLDELVGTATDFRRLYDRMAPRKQLGSVDFYRVFGQIWAAVEPHSELSYLGVGIAETGEYAMVHRPTADSLGVRMYLRDPETGPEIRDFQPTEHGLVLLERRPWTNAGDPRSTYDLRLRPFYIQAAKARRSVWTDSYQFWGGTDRGEIPGVSFATPIYDDSQQLTLVWDVDLELQSLSRFLQRVQQDVPGMLLIAEHRADLSWRLIAEPPPPSETDRATAQARLAAAAFVQSLPTDFSEAEELTRTTTTLEVGGRQWQVACAVLDGPDRPEWLIAEIWPSDAAPRPVPLSNVWFVIAFVAAGLFAALSAWVVSRWIAAPLQTLEVQARGLAAGERTQISLVGGPDEIGKLSLTLNHMAESVQQRQKQLEDANVELRMSRERLRAHIDKTPVGALEIDPRGHIVDWNPSAEKIFGWTFEEVCDRRFDFIVPEGIRPDIDVIVESLFRREGGFRSDNQNLTKEGRLIDCEWYNTPLVDSHGATFGIACLFLDVTERKRAEVEIRELNEQLEARVRARTAELRLALSDLESFSYSVAHDLRAPLRSIDGFSLALQEDCGEELTPPCREHLQRIRTASQRMSELIDALLRLARVVRQEMKVEDVDLSELVRQTLSRLRQTEPLRTANFQIQPDLRVSGDRQLLRVLVENLCDNAWKYSRPCPETTIDFFAEDRADGRWFAVRDNGVGFDQDFAHKAVEPFQRLHRIDEFEGHGIGLATAARIAQRHGGEVRLETVPGGGAACWFRLPQA